MRVKVLNLGNGVKRFEVEPMFDFEQFVPNFAIDEMIQDAIMQERFGSSHENTAFRHNECECKDRFERHECDDFVGCNHVPNREPDGIDIHVDRPLRENFAFHGDWLRAMSDYRNLELFAKRCDWECREPMRGTSNCMDTEFDDCFDDFDDEECFCFTEQEEQPFPFYKFCGCRF